MILCDIGNSKYHFLIDDKNIEFNIEDTLPILKDTIYYISVNEKATIKLNSFYKKTVDISKYVKLKTFYKGLGIDRKVACIYSKNSIIIDCGSAITIDIVKDGNHKGGYILPGINAYKLAYKSISNKLDHNINIKINLDKIPLNTKNAIESSIVYSILNIIKKIQSKDYEIIFTGGYGDILSSYIQNSHYKKNLILNNMKDIIYANNCFTKR